MFPKREIWYAVGKTQGIKSTISTRTKSIKQLNVSKTQDMFIDFRSEHPVLHRSLSFGSRQCKQLNHTTDWCKIKKKGPATPFLPSSRQRWLCFKSDIEAVLTFLVISFGELSKTMKFKGQTVDVHYHRHVLQKSKSIPSVTSHTVHSALQFTAFWLPILTWVNRFKHSCIPIVIDLRLRLRIRIRYWSPGRNCLTQAWGGSDEFIDVQRMVVDLFVQRILALLSLI